MIIQCIPDEPGHVVGELKEVGIYAAITAWTVRSPEVRRYKDLVKPNDTTVTLVLDRDVKYPNKGWVEFTLMTGTDSYVDGRIDPSDGVQQDGRVWIFHVRDVSGGRSSSSDGYTYLRAIDHNIERFKKASP